MKLFSKQTNPEVKRRLWRLNISPLFLVALIVLGYMIIVTGKIIWNNLQFNKEIKKIQAQINKLEEENTLLSEQILYLQTDSFKEKLARERLGLVKPGEKVLVIPPEKKPIELPKPIEAPKEPENWQKWFDYFFKKTS